MNLNKIFITILSISALISCSSSTSPNNKTSSITNGGINPNRLPPGQYFQTSSQVPLNLNDPLLTLIAPWQGGSNNTYLWSFSIMNTNSIYPEIILPTNDIVVAVIDTGIDKDHEDLVGRLWVNSSEAQGSNYNNGIDDDNNGYIDDFIGWDFANNTNNPADDQGHGTHTSGSIAATGGNGRGIVGVAPWVRIMPLKVCDSTGSCDSTDIRAAIRYAIDKKVDVINLSLGGIDSDGSESQTFQDLILEATQTGIFVAVSAGNYGIESTAITPANAQTSVAVAALRNDAQICSFSNYGTKIDFAAPGCSQRNGTEVSGIASLNSMKCGSSGISRCSSLTVLTNAYSLKSGTSMSSPHIAGLAAIAKTLVPNISAYKIRQALIQEASSQNNLFSKDFGYGASKISSQFRNTLLSVPGVKILSPLSGKLAPQHSIKFRIETSSSSANWKLKAYSLVSTDVNLDLSVIGTTIAQSSIPISSNSNVEIDQNFSPVSPGNYLLILEVSSNGKTYYDTLQVAR